MHVNALKYDSIAEELFQHTLLELKCNVLPLDGTSNKIRSTLIVYDNDNGIQSCAFGCQLYMD